LHEGRGDGVLSSSGVELLAAAEDQAVRGWLNRQWEGPDDCALGVTHQEKELLL
jgi:hypothetical protein